MAFTKKNYVDLTGLSTFKSSLLGTVINDTNKTTTSKTATIKAITDYVDSEVGDLSSAVTEGLANKVSSVTYDSTNKKIVYNKGGSTNTDVVTVATIKSAIGNFVKSGTGASSGLVPAPSTTAGSSKYLREDGTWVTPPNTTYSVFVKSGTGAKSGLVPAPSTTAGTSKYLREDGTWTTPPDTNTTYSNATSSSAGLMGADDKAKLDGITASADSVSFSRSLTSGTKVGTITINGTGTDLYAPTNTDTHYTAKNVVSSSNTGTGNVGEAISNPYINLIENGAVRSTHRISGSGATTVKTDASGNIIISSTDTNTTYDNATASKAGLMGADDKAKLNGIATGAEVNQNAFSNVKVGNVTIEADSKTDTLTLVAGSNVTITPDSANDKITIASSYVNTTYSPGTDLSLSGTTFNHANSGVTAGTYRSVTVNARGHVTGGSNPTTLSGYGITDAKIANGVITLGSNTITPLTSSSSLNASKLTGTISVDRLPATALERCVVVANDTARFALTTSSVQVGDTVKVTDTKKMYMVVNSSKLSTEAGYEEYFTSTDWSTITNKPSSYYTHPAHTAQKSGLYKITVDALGHVSGVTSVTKADITGLGIPGSDTNTHYTAIPVLGATDATSNATSVTSNPYLNIVENSAKSGGIQIKGGGATSVSAINGVITISSTDNNTTYSVMKGATSSEAGTSGLVPAPAKGQQASFLRGDGTWVVPTDTKVTSAVGNTTKAYLVGSTSSSDATGTLIKDTNVYLDTTAGKLVATTFVGSLSGTATKATQDSAGQQINTTYIKSLSASGQTVTITKGNGSTSTFTTQDTKNTAGSTDTDSKIYLIGATSQASNPQTYSDNQVYATSGQLDANKVRVAEKVTLQYNSSTESLDFVFA